VYISLLGAEGLHTWYIAPTSLSVLPPSRECQRLLLCSPADPAPPTLLLQSVAIVLAVASFIVIFAAMINERNRVIQWTALCSSFFAAAAVFVLSAFALRFANQFRLKTVRCACFCRCACLCCCCLVGMPPCAIGRKGAFSHCASTKPNCSFSGAFVSPSCVLETPDAELCNVWPGRCRRGLWTALAAPSAGADVQHSCIRDAGECAACLCKLCARYGSRVAGAVCPKCGPNVSVTFSKYLLLDAFICSITE
jgi:hypothetical protein